MLTDTTKEKNVSRRMIADAEQIHPTNQEEPRKSNLAKLCPSWEQLLHHCGEPFEYKTFQPITDSI